MRTKLFTAGILLALVFASCASKPAPNNGESELRENKENMMKKLDEGTAASESNK